MPNKANARKAQRQTAKHTQRNQKAMAELKSLRVKLRKFTDTSKPEEIKELARQIAKKLDKAQGKGILKKNTTARLKSRMMKKVNAMIKK